MSIHTINLLYMPNDRHFQFIRNFCQLVERFGANVLHVTALFAQLLAHFAREDEALKKIVASPITKRIADADKARDNTFSGMVEITHAYLKYYDPVVAEAARRLNILFNTYGNIAKKPVKEETSAVYNILQELRGGFAADCTAVTISAWVSRLELENNIVNQLTIDRVDESAAKTTVVLKDARREVDNLFRDICDIINAHILLEGAAAYEPFVKPLNELIKKFAVKRRHRHGAAAEDAGEEADAVDAAPEAA